MLFRNLMAMDAEEMIRAQPIDGVVLLARCDKTTPAHSWARPGELPAIMVTGGPMLPAGGTARSWAPAPTAARYITELRRAT